MRGASLTLLHRLGLCLLLFLSLSYCASSHEVGHDHKRKVTKPVLTKAARRALHQAHEQLKYLDQHTTLLNRLTDSILANVVATGLLWNDDSLVAAAYFNKGRRLYLQGKKDSALALMDGALRYTSAAIGDNKRLMSLHGTIHLDIAIALRDMMQLNSALEQANHALENFRLSNDSLGMAKAYNTLGIIISWNGKQASVSKYFLKAAELYGSLGKQRGQAFSYNNLSLHLAERGHLDSALIYWKLANAYMGKSADNAERGMILHTLAEIYNYSKMPDSAMVYLDQAMSYAQAAGEELLIIETYLQQCISWQLKGNCEAALKIANATLPRFEKASVHIHLARLYQCMAKCYAERKDYARAYDALAKEMKVRQRIHNETSHYLSQEFDTRSQLHNQELEIQRSNMLLMLNQQELESNNKRLILVLILLVAVSIASILIARLWNKARIQQARLEHQAEALHVRERDLRQMVNIRNRLYSILAHDLRSGIGTMKSLPDVLPMLMQSNDEDYVNQFASALRTKVDGTYDLLISLLTWADLQSTASYLKQDEVDLESIVKGVMVQLQTQAESKLVAVVLETDDSKKPVIKTNPDGLSFILRNVLTNAIKFSYSDTTIKIRIQHMESYVSLSITDQGIGMASELLSKLFVPDHGKRRPGTDGEQSTGLGLIFVKEIADQLGIELAVQSQINFGTTFTLQVPTGSNA